MIAIITKRLWMMNLQGSVLILIVLMIRKVLNANHVPKRHSCWLWLLVCIRLLCPFWIESNIDGLSAIHTIESKVIEIVSQTEQVSSDLSDEVVAETENKSLAERESSSSGRNEEQAGFANDSVLLRFLQVVYISGALLTTIVYIVQYAALKRKISAATRDREGIWYSEFISSPFVMGVFHTRIYLPYGLDENDKKQILLHERTHIAHHDPIFHLIGTICLCIHWWNPLVWMAIRRMNADAEMYCDESVIKEFSWEERKEYAKLLFVFAIRQSNLTPGIYFGKSNTEIRITNILEDKREKSFLVYAVAVMAFASFCVLMTAPVRSTAYAIDQSSGNEVTIESNLQDGSATESGIMDERSIEGVWATTGKYCLSRVCALSEDDILMYVDAYLEYEKDRYHYSGAKNDETYAIQGYNVENVTRTELQKNFGINPSVLGDSDGGCLYEYTVEEKNADMTFGETVLLVNKSSGYVYWNGVFFEISRIE